VLVSVKKLRTIRNDIKVIKTTLQESFNLEVFNGSKYSDKVRDLNRAILKLDDYITKAEVEVDADALAFDRFEIDWSVE